MGAPASNSCLFTPIAGSRMILKIEICLSLLETQPLCRPCYPRFEHQSSHSPGRLWLVFQALWERVCNQNTITVTAAQALSLLCCTDSPGLLQCLCQYPAQPRSSELQVSCAGAQSEGKTNPPFKTQLQLSVTIKVDWQSATKFNPLENEASVGLHRIQDSNTQAVQH